MFDGPNLQKIIFANTGQGKVLVQAPWEIRNLSLMATMNEVKLNW